MAGLLHQAVGEVGVFRHRVGRAVAVGVVAAFHHHPGAGGRFQTCCGPLLGDGIGSRGCHPWMLTIRKIPLFVPSQWKSCQ